MSQLDHLLLKSIMASLCDVHKAQGCHPLRLAHCGHWQISWKYLGPLPPLASDYPTGQLRWGALLLEEWHLFWLLQWSLLCSKHWVWLQTSRSWHTALQTLRWHNNSCHSGDASRCSLLDSGHLLHRTRQSWRIAARDANSQSWLTLGK